jgi:hypothetical protein
VKSRPFRMSQVAPPADNGTKEVVTRVHQ